jgi:hypothetical protein
VRFQNTAIGSKAKDEGFSDLRSDSDWMFSDEMVQIWVGACMHETGSLGVKRGMLTLGARWGPVNA